MTADAPGLLLADCPTPLGVMLLAATGEALVGAWFEGQAHFGGGWDLSRAERRDSPLLCRARAWIGAYFAGERPGENAMPPLDPRGTPFQLAVWNLLRTIPYGSTTTYGSLSSALRRSGIRACPQAVGGAVGRNPLCLFIPCHRVLGADGSLTGYAAGKARKKQLLGKYEALRTPKFQLRSTASMLFPHMGSTATE